MKRIALLISICLVNSSFALKRKKQPMSKTQKNKFFELKQIGVGKRLVKNPETGIVSLVAAESAETAGSIPLVVVNKLRIDWARMRALNAPRTILNSNDPEIVLSLEDMKISS